jgi:hypothetical protein
MLTPQALLKIGLSLAAKVLDLPRVREEGASDRLD